MYCFSNITWQLLELISPTISNEASTLKKYLECESPIPLLRSIMPSIYLSIFIPNSFASIRAGFEFRQISMRLAQHPNWEWKLEQRVRDSAIFVKYTLNCFLRPGTVLRKERKPWEKKECGIKLKRIKTYGSLSWHNQLNSLFDGFRIRIFRIHEGHNCPTRLHNLCILMFHPSTQLTRLWKKVRSTSYFQLKQGGTQTL